MDKPQKEPTPLNQRQDLKVCLSCGYPNRTTDSRCMYCSASLKEGGSLLSWFRHTYYVLRWRWELKQKRENLAKASRPALSLKTAGFFILGALLGFAGMYLFIDAIAEKSFSDGIIALLLLLYGFFTLKTLIVRR